MALWSHTPFVKPCGLLSTLYRALDGALWHHIPPWSALWLSFSTHRGVFDPRGPDATYSCIAPCDQPLTWKKATWKKNVGDSSVGE
jgi:hypothetical protein